jgi:hypothetical protein
MKWIGTLVLLAVMAGCSPSSSEEFRQEGEALCRSLTKELQQVNTRDDLVKMTPLLKKRFSQFAGLVMAARAFQREHAGEAMPEHEGDFLSSEVLMEEMKRIYTIEGGRKIIEDAQREALFALDGYLKSLDKDKASR